MTHRRSECRQCDRLHDVADNELLRRLSVYQSAAGRLYYHHRDSAGWNDSTFDNDGTGTANRSTLVLAAGANNLLQDFGYVGTGSIGDRVWYDRDSDGVQDAAEPGFSNVTVALDIDFNQDGTVDYTITTATNTSGNYLFPNLPAGSYTVRIPTVPSGTAQTFDADGTGTVNRSSRCPCCWSEQSDSGLRLPRHWIHW